MIQEEWRDIPDYEDCYQVSNLGRIKGLGRMIKHPMGGLVFRREIIKKLHLGKRGYFTTSLSKDGISKTYQVHQLVAIAFLNHTPCGHKIEVDHINQVKTDNRLDNIQLLSGKNHRIKDNKIGNSKYRGVCWVNSYKKWCSYITVNNKIKYLGSFKTELEAYKYFQASELCIKEGRPEDIITTVKPKSSKYKGVSWCKTKKRWRSNIGVDGKRKHLGYFNTELEAHLSCQNES